jgi:hypothetical protein
MKSQVPDAFVALFCCEVERYFVLDGNQLRYYRKRGDPAPRGTYVLTEGCVVGKVFNSEEKHKHHGEWNISVDYGVFFFF